MPPSEHEHQGPDVKRETADLVQAARQVQEDIRQFYGLHEKEQPVMLLDLQEQRVYAYLYENYEEMLTKRSQTMLAHQYQQARQDDKIVVFVKDEATRRLISFLLARE